MLVFHGLVAARQRAYELLQIQRPRFELPHPVLGQDLLARLQYGASRETITDLCQRTEREVRPQLAAVALDEILPHQATR